MNFHKDVISGCFILFLCCIGAYSVMQLPATEEGQFVGPATLPKVSLFALAVCAIILMVRGFYKSKTQEEAKYNFCVKSIGFYFFYLFYLIVMVKLGSYFITQNWIRIPFGGGFVFSTLLFLLIGLPILGRRNKLEIISIAVITTSILVVTFGVFFKILLP